MSTYSSLDKKECYREIDSNVGRCKRAKSLGQILVNDRIRKENIQPGMRQFNFATAPDGCKAWITHHTIEIGKCVQTLEATEMMQLCGKDFLIRLIWRRKVALGLDVIKPPASRRGPNATGNSVEALTRNQPPLISQHAGKIRIEQLEYPSMSLGGNQAQGGAYNDGALALPGQHCIEKLRQASG